MNDLEPKFDVSIIVPVYNSEKYLELCLESLVNQTLSSIEIICVDNGSSDSSLQIAEQYQISSQGKVKVIREEKKGAWFARLKGIKTATGKYIAFCDSDDVPHKDMYARLLFCANKEHSQITICGFNRIEYSTGKVLSREMDNNNNICLVKDLRPAALLNTSLWNKLFSYDIIDEIVNLEKVPNLLEDAMLLMCVYPKVDKIAFVNDVLYDYNISEGSLLNSPCLDDLDTIISSLIETKKFVVEHNEADAVVPFLDLLAFIHLGVALPAILSRSGIYSIEINKKMEFCLDEHFSLWNQKLSFNKHVLPRQRMFKINLAKFLYRTRLFPMMISVYNFMCTKLRIEIKW